jgi:hypothetical protein
MIIIKVFVSGWSEGIGLPRWARVIFDVLGCCDFVPMVAIS